MESSQRQGHGSRSEALGLILKKEDSKTHRRLLRHSLTPRGSGKISKARNVYLSVRLEVNLCEAWYFSYRLAYIAFCFTLHYGWPSLTPIGSENI